MYERMALNASADMHGVERQVSVGGLWHGNVGTEQMATMIQHAKLGKVKQDSTGTKWS